MVTPQAMRFISLHFVTRCYVPLYKEFLHIIPISCRYVLLCILYVMCYLCVKNVLRFSAVQLINAEQIYISLILSTDNVLIIPSIHFINASDSIYCTPSSVLLFHSNTCTKLYTLFTVPQGNTFNIATIHLILSSLESIS